MRPTLALAVWTLCLSFPAALPAAEALTGPLADYVGKADPSYAWKLRREGTIGGTQYAELTLTSQTWRGVTWKHQLFLLKPKSAGADAKHALLFIAGGRWNDALAAPPADDKLPGEARTLAWDPLESTCRHASLSIL